MKLLSMTDFVLEQTTPFEGADKLDFLEINYNQLMKIKGYAKFLKRPLKLEMFVPCDEEGNVLEDPKLEHSFDVNGEVVIYEKSYKIDLDEHQKAKEKVLFEGFEVFEDMYHSTKRTFIRNKRKILISVYNKFQYHDGKIEETNPLFGNHKVIEDLIKYDLTLTPSALKQLGL